MGKAYKNYGRYIRHKGELNMTNIWFNHWFSTAYHLINLMKSGNPDKFYFIGSSRSDTCIFTKACDEKYSEPKNISDKEYINFCLDFCRKHNINIFAPRHNIAKIVNHYKDFQNIGVKLFADTNSENASILDDKIMTYQKISEIQPGIIPEYYEVKSFEYFLQIYEKLREKYKRICYKLSVDEGACSFRIIDENLNNISALLNSPNHKISPESAFEILKKYDFKIPMLVMPYLNGVEISADCLNTPDGNIIIPRYKNGRYEEIIFDENIMQICNSIINFLSIKMPLNIQFRYMNNKPYLLEINPRMSGGLQASCMAANINIPGIALNQLMGINISWKYPDFKSVKIANLETPVFPDYTEVRNAIQN